VSSISRLSRHRWTLPILAQLAKTGGSRFVPLTATLGLSRDSLRQTLDALIDLGLVIPNPGYGHPTRPEYVLTETGGRVAPACARIVEYVQRNGLDIVAFKKWSLPTVAALGRPQRYGELRRATGATSRALTLTLKDLVSTGVVKRRVSEEFPPGTSYRLTPSGRALRNRVMSLEGALEEIAPKDPDLHRRRAYRHSRKRAYKASLRAKQQA
jgi:DNA-binding HxlR family transcriptional regulator